MNHHSDPADPILQRGLGTPGDLDNIPGLVQNFPYPGVASPEQEPWQELAEFRSQFPFLGIVPLPARVLTMAIAANQPGMDMALPDDCSLVRFQGYCVPPLSGLIAVSFDGRAPTFNSPVTDNFFSGALLLPITGPSDLFYIKGKKMVSFSASANCYVQAMTWTTKNVTKGNRAR